MRRGVSTRRSAVAAAATDARRDARAGGGRPWTAPGQSGGDGASGHPERGGRAALPVARAVVERG